MKPSQRLMLFAIAVCGGCGGDAPPAGAPAVPGRAAAAIVVQTQVAASTPCAWLPPADVEKLVGSGLAQAAQRVLSAENPRPADMGEACLYEFPDASAGKTTIVVQLIPDESGAMQTAFQGVGNVETEFKHAPRTKDTGPASRWDFVSVLPGGLTALRQGRIAAQVSSTATMADKALALVTTMLDRIADLPFVLNQQDATVPGRDPDPCRLITRAEAEAVLGPLIVAPYRSRKATALAYGSGGSCSYYSAHHRALVLTPKESHGAQLFGMLGSAEAKVARQLHTPGSVDAATGDWDQMSMGIDGALHALKGDKMLSVQFITSPADQAATAKLLALALPRL
jgi:hypothetical protein